MSILPLSPEGRYHITSCEGMDIHNSTCSRRSCGIMIPDIASYAANMRLTSGPAAVHLRSAARFSVRPMAPRLHWVPHYSAHVPDQWSWRRSLFWTCEWQSFPCGTRLSHPDVVAQGPACLASELESIVHNWHCYLRRNRGSSHRMHSGAVQSFLLW